MTSAFGWSTALCVVPQRVVVTRGLWRALALWASIYVCTLAAGAMHQASGVTKQPWWWVVAENILPCVVHTNSHVASYKFLCIALGLRSNPSWVLLCVLHGMILMAYPFYWTGMRLYPFSCACWNVFMPFPACWIFTKSPWFLCVCCVLDHMLLCSLLCPNTMSFVLFPAC